MVVLDSVQDYARGALVSQGRRDFDIVTLVRVRQCGEAALNCSTVAVDDYRYEGSQLVSGEQEWFLVIATLRAVGQLYVWARFAFFVCALVVVESQTSSTLVKKIRSVIRTFLFIPGHIVVYGSFIPVICYAAAHLLDSCVVYEKVREDFSALEGLFSFNFVAFIRSATISMRSVWIVASICHIMTWISTHRHWTHEHGVPGVHKFFIAFVSSFTVLAHLRIPNWRDCRIVQIEKVLSSQRMRDIKSVSLPTRSTAGAILFGSPSDFQFIALGLSTVIAIIILRQVARRCLSSRRQRSSVLFHTRVPYSCQWLWSSDTLIVNWANVMNHSRFDKPEIPSVNDHTISNGTNACTNVEFFLNSKQKETEVFQSRRSITVMPQQHQGVVTEERSTRLLGLEYRSRDVLAFIVTLNLTIMSDPLVFYQLRRLNADRLVGLYEHQATGKLWLLPLQSSAACVDASFDWDDLRRIAVFTTNELAWVDLLHCG
ncbi:hypothetical protein PINS_up022258 [Pythium insidiosum]|nr:hypothetical protein PINS_up022258 [Pythium insidiosum]